MAKSIMHVDFSQARCWESRLKWDGVSYIEHSPPIFLLWGPRLEFDVIKI